MVLKRFEFGEVGFFHAMDLLGDLTDEEKTSVKRVESEFDKVLSIPDVFLQTKQKNLYSFFTPKGLDRFENCMNVLLRLFRRVEDSGIGELADIEIASESARIVYQDGYQAVVEMLPSEIEELRKKAANR